MNLAEIRAKWQDCQACPLSKLRTKFVLGRGSETADIALIGEAPGRNENASGKAFVGRAGQLLDVILEKVSIPLERVFIFNVVGCWPMLGGKNRRPTAVEVRACHERFMETLNAICPRIVVLMGATAIRKFFSMDWSVAQYRERGGSALLTPEADVFIFPTYHPAAYLYGDADQVVGRKHQGFRDWQRIAHHAGAVERLNNDQPVEEERQSETLRSTPKMFRRMTEWPFRIPLL